MDVDVPSSNGGVSLSPPYSTYHGGTSQNYEVGTDVTVEAKPFSGYKFDHWEGDHPYGEEDSKSITVEMDEDRSLTPVFEEKTTEYDLDVDASGNGDVQLSPPYDTYSSYVSRQYEEGTDVTLEADPESGYNFDYWQGDHPYGEEDSRTITVEMDEAKSLTPVFVEEVTEYDLDVDASGNGEVEVSPPYDTYSSYASREYEEGSDVTLEADPESGYKFDHWEGDHPYGEENSETITVEMDGDKSLTPVFVEEVSEYDLEVDSSGNGDVELSPPYDTYTSIVTQTYEEGTDVTLEADPESGYKFDHWEGDHPYGEENSETITVEMDEAKSLTPVFAEEVSEYDLDVASPGTEGDVDVSPSGSSYGGIRTYEGVRR
ncbi:InlB B-repeat-containing protein [Halorussus caseinilyticus]|uniref:InlB B-repeat-containing protein n=1 Tax=Halorussus caseinilyticus TaxID=3034025 RepID=A0ABD5WID5_9EURY